jgi:hypothetical protein
MSMCCLVRGIGLQMSGLTQVLVEHPAGKVSDLQEEPYFPLRSFYFAESVSWLEEEFPGADGVSARWIDETALSGERFLRIVVESAASVFAMPVQWVGIGALSLRLRSRQMVPGGLRVVAADGTVLAGRRLLPQTEWGNISVPLPAHVGAARLVLAPDGSAQWDVRTLEYQKFDRAGWLADLRRREAEGHPANLLPHSRFPLGLPQGWTLDRDSCPSEGLQLRASSGSRGPSGSPLLRLEARRGGWLRSPAFVGWPDASSPDEALPHVASLWVGGEGTLTVRVLAGTRSLAEQVLQAKASGEKVQLTFIPPADDTLLCLELQWSDAIPGIFLDAVRVVPARCAGDSRLGRFPVEVAVAAEDPEALHGPGEPLRIRTWVSEASPGDALHLVAQDLYGRCAERRIVLQDPGPVGMVFDDPALAEFGSYRIHVWVTQKDGGAGSGVGEMIVHRLPAPRFAAHPAPASRFGVHVLPTTRHLRMARAIGMKWVRLHGPASEINYWFDVEPEPGRWVLQPARLARFRDAGFSVLGKFTTTPRWASGQTKIVHTYFDQFVAPQELGPWREYVRRLLTEYGSSIDVYEVWNEPWLDKFFSAGVELLADGSRHYVRLTDPAAAYADLTRATREEVDAGGNRPPLIGLNTTTNRDVEGWIDGDEWTRRARVAGALDPVDIFSYHDYDRAADSLGQFDLSRRQFAFALGPELSADGRASRPVWNTEGSPEPAGVGPGLYQMLLPHWNEGEELVWQESERLARYLLGQFSARVEKVFLYTMHNAQGFTGINGFTVLLAPDGTLHPTATSLAALARALDPLPFAEIRNIPGGRSLRFAAVDGSRATEVFLAARMAPDALPPDRDGYGGWRDLFGNSVDAGPCRGATFFRETLTQP